MQISRLVFFKVDIGNAYKIEVYTNTKLIC